MLYWTHLPKSSTLTSEKSLLEKEWHLLNSCRCIERSFPLLKIFMICVAEEQRITNRLSLTYKIITWQRSWQESALFQTEVVILSWVLVISISFTMPKWILNCTTILTFCSMTIEVENLLMGKKRRNWLRKKKRSKRKATDLMLVLSSYL